MNISGEIWWAKVNSEVDIVKNKEQGYGLCLYTSTKELNALKDFAIKMIDIKKNDPTWECAPGEKPKPRKGVDTAWEYVSSIPFKEDRNGRQFIVFKTKHIDKNGNRRYVDVFDKTGGQNGDQKFKDYENLRIGNRSKGNICFSFNVYWLSPTNHGIKFYLDAIQLTNLVLPPKKKKKIKKDGTAEGYGFEVGSLDFNDEIPV